MTMRSARTCSTAQAMLRPILITASSIPGTISLETVTPEMATDILSRNPNNRFLSEVFARYLARQVAAGQWKLSNDLAAIDTDDQLRNGQHRMRAVQIAGVPVQMRVWRGCPPDALFDEGRRRDTKDRARISGTHENARGWATTIRSMAMIVSTNHSGRVPFYEFEALYAANKPGIDWAIDAILKVRQTGFTGAVAAALAVAHPINPEKIEEFGEALYSGANLQEYSPALTLRRLLVESPYSWHGFVGQGDLSRRVLRACQAHLGGEKIKHIKPVSGFSALRWALQKRKALGFVDRLMEPIEATED